MTLARLAAFVLVLVACGADRTTPAAGKTPDIATADAAGTPTVPAQPERPRVSPPISGPTDAPNALACEAHDDCAVVPVLPAADACCDVTVTAAPVTRAYLQFMETWRRSACPAGHVCAANDLPGAQMAPTCYIGRCVAGTCALACNDPTFDPNAAPGLPP